MIERTYHAQNPVNIRILNHVAAMGQCTAAHLHAMFLPDNTSHDERKSMTNKLSYLVCTEQLLRQGKGKNAVLRIGPHAGAPGGRARREKHKYKEAEALAPCLRAAPAEHRPQVASAPDYDHMAADVYVPPPAPALRHGALQYKSCASHGCRC